MAMDRPYSWHKHGCTGVNSGFSGWTDKQRTVRSLQRGLSHDTVHRRDYNKPFYKRMIKTVAGQKVAGSGDVRSMFNVEHVQPQPQIVEYNINAGQNRLPELRDEICS